MVIFGYFQNMWLVLGISENMWLLLGNYQNIVVIFGIIPIKIPGYFVKRGYFDLHSRLFPSMVSQNIYK